MPRPFVNTPKGSIIIFEGRELGYRTSLPSYATEYELVVPVPLSEEQAALVKRDVLMVHVPAVPISARMADIWEMVAELMDVEVGSREWWAMYEISKGYE